MTNPFLVSVQVIEQLESITDEDSEKTFNLTNCKADRVVTKETASKQLDILLHTLSLEEVHRYHDSGDHRHVVKLLLKTFTPKKSSLSSADVEGRHEQLLLLKDSLLKLKDMNKCVHWVEVSLNEAL